MDFSSKLRKNIFFASNYKLQNFNGMGQKAIVITYTDNTVDILRTKPNEKNSFSTFDFNDDDEYYKFINFLEFNNVPKKITEKTCI